MTTRCFNCMGEYEGHSDICPHCGASTEQSKQESLTLKPGTLLQERYSIGRALGSGGFGVTYIGWDTVLQKKIAVKEFLPSGLATRAPGQTCVSVLGGTREEEFKRGLQSFYEEAVHLARFSEPGIVDIFDCIHENNTAYIIMEFLEGSTVGQLLQANGPMPLPQVLNILEPLLKSLEVIHLEGMLHRDIAPDNIIVTKNGSVKLIDFGAARSASSSHSKSMTVLFKEGYAPVEQYHKWGNQGPWSDIYALAATAYKMLTGTTPPSSIERIIKDTLQAPSKLGAQMPAYAEQALMRALSVTAENRTSSAAIFLSELIGGAVAPAANKARVGKKMIAVLAAAAVVLASWAVVSTAALLRRGAPGGEPKTTKAANNSTLPDGGPSGGALSANAAVGSQVDFGGYKWRVLDVQDGRMLVITEEIIEKRNYHDKDEDITWETCDLRKYLNGAFYNRFSKQDKARIVQVKNKNPGNSAYSIPNGNDTLDYIFLVSTEEAEKYFSGYSQRRARGAGFQSSDEYGSWFLRTSGIIQKMFLAHVDPYGRLNPVGSTFYVEDGVRPALWLKTTATPEPPTETTTEKNETVGTLINFGGYKWRILDVQADKILVITEEITESRKYHGENNATWETCDLRKYLNSEFYNSFSAQDKARIVQVKNETPDLYDVYDRLIADGGKDTQDYIFLLSQEEVEKYLPDNSQRVAVYSSQHHDKNALTWWLRSPANFNGPNTSAREVGSSGGLSGYSYLFTDQGVRPALWLKTE